MPHQLATRLQVLGPRHPDVVRVAAYAARFRIVGRKDRRLQVLLRLPAPLLDPALLLLAVHRAVAGAGEVGGAVEAPVAGGAAELAVGVRRGRGQEELLLRMAAEGLLPLLAVEAGAVGGHVAGDAAVDPLDRGEVDVLVEAGEDDLLDLQVGLDEVHERRVEHEVVDPLVQVGDPDLEGIEAAPQGLEPGLGLL